MNSAILIAAGTFLLVAIASPAAADPCRAIPDKGPSPAWLKAGATFQGKVRHHSSNGSVSKNRCA